MPQEVFSLRWPVCGSYEIKPRGKVIRCFRTVPIGFKPVWIELAVQRIFSPRCQVVRQVKSKFASWRRSQTHACKRQALELSRYITIKDVARHLGELECH